jgi:hypothetical protein
VERRRAGDGAVVEALRDASGRLCALAVPQWDATAKVWARKVPCFPAVLLLAPWRHELALPTSKPTARRPTACVHKLAPCQVMRFPAMLSGPS